MLSGDWLLWQWECILLLNRIFESDKTLNSTTEFESDEFFVERNFCDFGKARNFWKFGINFLRLAKMENFEEIGFRNFGF